MKSPHQFAWGRAALWAVPIGFLGYFFAYPVVRILALGLSEADLDTALFQSRLVGIAWFTLWQAAVSTVLTLLAAAPLTWAVSTHQFRARKMAMALVTVPFVMPTVVVGTAFVALGVRDSIWAILAAHVFFNIAVVVRTVSTLWSRIDPDLSHAAQVLGATPWEVFRRITLPLLRPALGAAASIVFLFTFTSFGVVLILGGFDFSTLEVEIFRQATNLFNLPLAAVLTIVQLTGVGGALLLYSRYQRRHTATWTLTGSDHLPRPRGRAAAAVTASVAGTLGLLAIPLVVMTARAFSSDGFGRLFSDDPVVGRPIQAAVNSLLFAMTAAVIATVIGITASSLLARSRGSAATWFDLALMLPLGTSAVTIGFGFIVALDWPFDLRASWILVPLAHSLVAIPFVVRSTLPTLGAIASDIRGAASTLGASPWRVWKLIDLPIVARSLMVGAGFSLVISLGEFGATSFIARPNTTTMPVMIFRLLSRPGQQSFAMAMAMAVIMALVTAAVVFLIDRAHTDELGVF